MNKCLGDLKDTICVPYLINVLWYGRTFDEHLENIKTVLKGLKGFGIKLKADNIFLSEVKYLEKFIHFEV